MYRKFVSMVSLVTAVVVGFCGSVFAQTSTAITVENPNLDWTSLPTQLVGMLTAPIIVGIGIALSIWVIFASVKFFRRSAG